MISRNAPCWCGSKKKWKKCHYPDQGKSVETFDEKASRYRKQYGILLKTPEQIKGIKQSCRLAANILAKACKMAKAGVTTNQINKYVMDLHQEAGAIAAPLGYGNPPFPKAICTSLNEVICHGIPDNTPLKNGDILNIDVTCILNGYYGDTSAMVMVGEVGPDKKRVVETSYHALMQAITILKPGVLVSDIAVVIEEIAKQNRCSVVHQFVAHGVGLAFHEPPQVAHHYNSVNIPLEEGMTFTIEPMINLGVAEGEIDKSDGWTARTLDRKPSAQWEHTVLITKDGHEILTLADAQENEDKPSLP